MPVPIGVGVGDFIAVGALAWKLYLACSNSASVEFRDLENICLSMYIAIKKIESNLEATRHDLQKWNDSEFGQLAKNCNESLAELDRLLKTYSSLTSKRRAVWDRIKFAHEDLAGLRAKLNLHLSAINAFTGGAQLETLTRIENRLNEISIAILRGDKDESLLSAQATEDEDVWENLRAELLEDYGITSEDLETHKDAIKAEISKILMDLDIQSGTLFPGDSASCRDFTTAPEDSPSEELEDDRPAQDYLVSDSAIPTYEAQEDHNFNEVMEPSVPVNTSVYPGLEFYTARWSCQILESRISQDGVAFAFDPIGRRIIFVETKTIFPDHSGEAIHVRTNTWRYTIMELGDSGAGISQHSQRATSDIETYGWSKATFFRGSAVLFEERTLPFEFYCPAVVSRSFPGRSRQLQFSKNDNVAGGAYCDSGGELLCFGGLQMTRRFARGFALSNDIKRLVRVSGIVVNRKATWEWQEIERLTPIRTNESKPPFRRDCSMVAWGGSLFIFGGYFRAAAFNDVWAFDLAERTWKEQPKYGRPTPRYDHQAVVCGNSMYVSSGREFFSGPRVETLERFNFESCRWSTVGTSGMGDLLSQNHVLASSGTTLFLVGPGAVYMVDTEGPEFYERHEAD